MKLRIPKLDYLSYQNILFGLFIVSGAIKFLFIFYNFPADITLIIFALIVFDVLKNFKLGIRRLTSNGIFFISVFGALILLSIFSLLYSPSESYKYAKVISFIISGTGFVYPLFIRQFSQKTFFKTLLVTIIPAALAFLIGKQIYWYGESYGFAYETRKRASELTGSYLALSDYLAMSIFYLVTQKKYIISILILLFIFALGAKGPFLITIFVLIFWKRNRILSYKIKKKTLKKIMASFLVILPLIIIYSEKIFSIFRVGLLRFSALFVTLENKGTDYTRLEYLGFALKGIFDSVFTFIFGNGIGSFGIIVKGKDVKAYPHNIFMESWFELGIIGLVLVLILLLVPLLIKYHNIVFQLCALYIFLNYLKSGTLDGARVLFLIYGCLIFVKNNKQEIIT